MKCVEKIAKILKTDKDNVCKIEKRLTEVTKKEKVLERIAHENESKIRNRLLTIGVSREGSAKEVYDALLSKIESDDNKLYQALNYPRLNERQDCIKVLSKAKEVSPSHCGFFLKPDKAAEFLEKEPPKKILRYLKYANVKDMLARENLYEVYAALRMIEDREWLNTIFFKQYESLTPDDFEKRDMVVEVLSEHWNGGAKSFVAKKWHNVSHLKELGVIFVIPATLGISGELLRMLSLVYHYYHEVCFYSCMFEKCKLTPTTFATNLISLLRGDVLDRRLSEGERTLWLVVQRYLAKEDENDWRLSEPRINPEAIHWLKSANDLIKLGNIFSKDTKERFSAELSFWYDLDWVGDFMKDESGVEVLVSFNLVDMVMGLVQKKELIKYLYHHQEALWNKIFIEYFNLEELEAFAKEYLLQGYFEI